MTKVYRSERTKEIAPIFLSNKISSTLIIPIGIARRYGLDRPSHVVLEETEGGILIKKLEI
jgi:hypothetical protein